MINKKRLLDEFLNLLKITCSTRNERQVADLLKRKLTDLGLTVTEDETGKKIGGNTGNIIAHLKATKEKAPKLFFSAHMDCVEPCENIKPQIKDGVIISDGTTILGSDDKAGIAPILEALHILKEKNIEHGDIQIIFTVAEEDGLLGTKNLDPNLIQADFGYCLDSSGRPGKIVIQAPGQDDIRVKIHGKSAHAGIAPEEGINAIVVAAKAIAGMKQGRLDHETTANVGIIQGGNATNIVPSLAEVTCEARSCDEKKLASQTNYMVELFETIAKENGATTKIKVEHCYRPYTLTQDMPVVKTAMIAMKNAGLEANPTPTGGGSDGNFYNAYGIPCAVLGVGMTKVHTTEEFILEEDLYQTAQLVLELVQCSMTVK
ncbi:MAG: peptidase T-like protein [Firmicutes bacterium]|nr:peptidase T-like protein [Bacillota bacterium]